MEQTLESIYRRTKWFRDARFGMFIHWGLYAIPGKGEWIRSHQSLSIEDYQPYFEAFNPTHYNPRQWAKEAKAAGMKYMVLTAKHHDGFCLFDSAYTDYKATNTKIGRDLVAEFVEAVRAEGLKVGLYYSLLDWHHPDYPKYGDPYHPMRNHPDFKDEDVDFDHYVSYLHHQVEELVTKYGKLDILWFDFSYEGKKGEDWRASELIHMVRKYQPDVLVDNRLEASGEGFGSLVTDHIQSYSGDFVSPEQILPHQGIRNCKGDLVPWELCLTMNNSWAYNPTDLAYKSPKTFIRKLVECVSKGGNMILNVGPNALGEFPKAAREILKEIGIWLEQYGEAIYENGLVNLPKPEWGYYTQKGSTIYAHVFEQPIGPLALPGITEAEVKRMSFLHDGSEVCISNSWTTTTYPDMLFAQYGDVPHFTYPLPNEMDSVIKIERGIEGGLPD
ncbi:alpha-L-fucosidase [Streptococcus sp. DD13]|uniref:alpha-L-fucosidase n=1 Tax=Streptococcus sp. DD13 TaxID=1777881 RepID=UPI00082CB511|nr:alpha-L-fucosidase [Streptococcus sp. DD13]